MKKEGKAWRRPAIAAAVLGGVLITAAISALYIPSLGVVDLREVKVSGNRHASASEIVALSGLTRGRTLSAISTSRIAQRIAAHPWVRSVRVSRRWPHTIQIAVAERDVVAWVREPGQEGCLLLGEDGVILTTDCGETVPQLELCGALAEGWSPGARLVDDRVSQLIEELRADDLHSLRASCLNVSNLASIELLADDDLRVRLGDIDGVNERVRALIALGRRIDFRDYELIDLRFGGEATLVPRKAVRR